TRLQGVIGSPRRRWGSVFELELEARAELRVADPFVPLLRVHRARRVDLPGPGERARIGEPTPWLLSSALDLPERGERRFERSEVGEQRRRGLELAVHSRVREALGQRP